MNITNAILGVNSLSHYIQYDNHLSRANRTGNISETGGTGGIRETGRRDTYIPSSMQSMIVSRSVQDRVEISPAAYQKMALDSAGIWNDLPPKEQAILMDLKATDAKVKAHEQAHLSAAGGYATGGANFTYTVGPDGKPYATGGEVQIDTSPIHGDPEATIKKAKTIQKAALAPMDPSTQDRAVAAKAAAMERLARTEMVGPEKQSINVISNSTIGNVEMLNSEKEIPKNYGPNQNSSYSAGKQIDLTA